jgi:hypothetical protein
MKNLITLIISGALVVSGYAQTRNVLVGTNGAVVQPTNFWSADASNARTGLGFGTAATNPSTAFQSSSLALSNLASSNAINLTNINASNIVGIVSLAQGGTGSTNVSAARTAFGLGTAATNDASAFQSSSLILSNLAISNGGALTNIAAANIVGVISESNLPPSSFTNFSGTLSITQGGTGATNAANARQNLGSTTVGDAVFIATNTSVARTAIGVGPSNNVTFSNLALGSLTGGTLIIGADSGGQITKQSLLSVPATTYFIGNVGSALTNWTSATARTNLGLGWSALTNTDATNFRNAIGLGVTNVVRFESIQLYQDGETTNSITYGADSLFFNQNGVEFFSLDGAAGGTIVFRKPILFLGTNASSNAAVSRTNLGIPWSGLTNANAATFQSALFGSNTNPVLVNTNGEVVSPTNFWQAAPISTTVQYQTNVTETSTNAATNSRNLFLFSLAPSVGVTNVTNIVTLPTNPATTFEGDRATITHLANSTNAVTVVRQLGAETNLITLNQLDETVLLMYRSGAWRLADNISYIEPIYFSGTNAAANAAASRTNLGLGANNSPTFAGLLIEQFGVEISTLIEDDGMTILRRIGTNTDIGIFNIGYLNSLYMLSPISFNTTNIAAATRTNLGLGQTNNVTFSNVTASGTLTATGTVTATTNLVVDGFVDFTTNRAATNGPTNAGNFNNHAVWITIKAGTNTYFLPAYK